MHAFRERIWANYQINDKLTLNTRLAHRWQKMSSNIGHPNDRGPATWEWEDELVVDSLNVQINQVFRFIMEPDTWSSGCDVR